MEMRVQTSLREFQAWRGGRDTLDVLNAKGDTEKVEALIDAEYCEEMPTETEVNDFLWFETDFIAEALGFADWEEYENS